MKNKLLLKVILPLTSVLFLVSGCGTDADLAKVRKFSENAGAIEQALPVIADDFYKSCLRSARYEPIDIISTKNKSTLNVVGKRSLLRNINKKLDERDYGLLAKKDLKPLEQKLAVNSLIENPLQARLDAEKECGTKSIFDSSNEEQIPRMYLGSLMKKGDSLIVLYMKKLGVLASDGLVNFDKEFNSLSANLTNLEGELADLLKLTAENKAEITKATTAGVSLASFIVNQIFKGKRIETLNESISIVNEPLSSYAKGLQAVVEKVYVDQYLKTEESFLDDYYVEYISEILESNERERGDSVVNIANTLIAIERDRWNPEKDKIQERRELAFSYIKLLRAAVDGHAKLATIYNNGKQPSGKEINKVIEANNKAANDFVSRAMALQRNSE